MELIGLHADTAIRQLHEAGICVKLIEVRARKRIENGEPRIIRVKMLGDKHAELCYSLFKVKLDPNESLR
ncbi:MAG: hypothetical protein IJA35_06710 [Clostridia bacterium]|nr:hypothetical protein [Clostridia bacterium]